MSDGNSNQMADAGHGGEALHHAEGLLIVAVEWLKLGVEFIGAGVIAVGVVVVVLSIIRMLSSDGQIEFTRIQIRFARYLALALEFQLAADILATAVAPTLEQIGMLGAIAVIRTALNFFLHKEIHDARKHLKEEEEALSGKTSGGP